MGRIAGGTGGRGQRQRNASGSDMLGQLIVDSLLRPRSAARAVLGMVPPADVLLQAALAVTCLGMVLGFVAVVIGGGPVDPVSAALISNPLVGAAIQFAIMIAVAMLTFRIGGLFGGTGGFLGALTIVVWLNAVMLAIQFVQIAAMLLVPPLAGLVALVAVFWLLWAFANFVAELHGFGSPFVVLGVSILTVIVLVFGLTMLAAILGITPQGVQ